MQRIGPFNPATGAPGAPTDTWTNEDLNSGIEGSIPPAEFFNDVQSEICDAIDHFLGDGTEGSGQVAGDLTQLRQVLLAVAGLGAQPGDLKMRAASNVPNGWRECDGSEVSRAEFADLFAVIGTTYGDGDGATTFNLPDLRGEFLRGWDNGRGIDDGRALGSNQAQEIQRHGHTMTTTTRSLYDTSGGPNGYGQDTSTGSGPNVVINDYVGADDETRPRNVAVMYVIKT